MSVGAASGSASPATVTVLGPVGLSLAGTVLALTPSERTLLAGIAVHLGRPVSATHKNLCQVYESDSAATA